MMSSNVKEKEFKSKKTLTELLDVQIDLNEKLTSENIQFYEQQKKFLALISKKERKIDEMKGLLQKNAKPLILSLINHCNKMKKEFFGNMIFIKRENSKKSYILKLFYKKYKTTIGKAFSNFKIQTISMKFNEKNYLNRIKTMNMILEKIDKRKKYGFSQILKFNMMTKHKSLQHKLNKIAAFKLFYFAEKIDKIIYRKKSQKYFLSIWSSISKTHQTKNYDIFLFSLIKIFNNFFFQRKKAVFSSLKNEFSNGKKRILLFSLQMNDIFSKKLIYKTLFIAFNQVKNYSKSVLNKKLKTLKIYINFEKGAKRLAFRNMKNFNEKLLKAGNLLKIIRNCFFKKIFKYFMKILTIQYHIPDLFPNSRFLHKMKKIKLINLGNTLKSKSIMKNHKKEKKANIKRKLIRHENAIQEYFISKKLDFENYFTTILNVMKDSQMNLNKQTEENNVSLKETKKFQEEANMKLLEENHKLEKKLMEKQEALKLQGKEKERNIEIIKKYEEKYKLDIEKLTLTIDSLAQDKGDLLSKLEESLQHLNELRNEYTDILNQLNISETDRKKLTESYKLQEKKIMILEKKNEEVENNFMLINKKSPLQKPNKDKEKVKEKFEKSQREKKELEEKLKQILEKYEKIKKLNMELTKEAISLNEEKFDVKNIIANLKDNLQGSKNTIISLESKNKQLENELIALRTENQNIMSSKMKKHDSNLNKVNEENNLLKIEANKLKTELQNSRASLENSLLKIKSQEENNNNLKRTIDELNHKEQQMNYEFKSLNDSLATLNKEKVNLMREMTLIHENNLALEKELNKYRELAFQSQNEIENYQNQLDVYSKVLKIMQEKVNNIENKSFEAVNKTHKFNENLNDGELLNKIYHLKSKLTQGSPEKGEN